MLYLYSCVQYTRRLVEGADDRRAAAEGRLPRHADGGDAARDREGGALPEREGERVALGVRVLQARRAAPAGAQLIGPAAFALSSRPPTFTISSFTGGLTHSIPDTHT